MDDNTLLVAFQHGEPSAEKAVFDRYFGPLVLYANRITGDLAAVGDIAVDALVKTIDRREDFSALPKLKSFLYQVVHNSSINHVTSHQRHRGIHAKIQYQQQYEEASEDVVETEILRAEVLQEIYEEVENLPGRCQQIFKLLFVHGKPTEEIGKLLDINPQTVRTQSPCDQPDPHCAPEKRVASPPSPSWRPGYGSICNSYDGQLNSSH
jgi:RNA polymerase sigma factor (sigma-70 family)